MTYFTNIFSSKRIFAVFLLLLYGKILIGQSYTQLTLTDTVSLNLILNQVNDLQVENNKISLYNLIGARYEAISDYPKSLNYLFKAHKLNQKFGSPKDKIFTLNYLGYVYWHKSLYDSALFYHNQAIQLAEQKKIESSETAFSYLLVGSDYYDLGDYIKTSDYFFKSLRSYEKLNDTIGLILVNNRLSKLYFKLKDYKTAKRHANIANQLNLKIKYNREFAASNNSLGNISIEFNALDSALFYFKKTLAYYILCGDKIGQAVASINLGDTYFSIYKKNKAKKIHLDSSFYYYKKSYLLNNEVDNKFGMVYGLWGMADVELLRGENNNALKNYRNALQQAISINAKSEEYNLYWKMYKVFEAIGNKDSSYQYLKNHVELKSTIEHEEQTKALLRQESKYEIEKSVSEQVAKRKQEKLISEEKSKRKNYIIIGVVLIAIMLIYVVFVSRKRLKIIKYKNEIINTINTKLTVQKKEITDSINYARRIQDAILPSENYFKECNVDSFVLYKPKDIVAGDFYWLEKKDNIVFIAVADCTGHGVPGAMVSVVCSNALNRTVLEFGITEPGKILNKTRELVLDTFSKSDKDVKDGMDITLVAIDKNNNSLSWAGANTPLWYVLDNCLYEIKPDKQPIGKTENPMPFTTHKLNLKSGDLIYLISDGYADQFGGIKGKKFKYKTLKEIIAKNSDMPLELQKQALDLTFVNWKGDLEQVDDVCIVGIKL